METRNNDNGGNGAPKKSKAFVIGVSVFAVLFVAFVVVGILFYTGVFENKTACVVNGEEISTAEFDFNFATSYNAFTNYYGQYLQYFGLDTTKPLSDQQYAEGMTWQQFFENQAYASIREAVALSNEAKKNNISLIEADNVTIDSYMDSIKIAAEAGKVSMDEYIKTMYGKAVNEANLRKSLERLLLADRFTTEKTASFEYADADIESYYKQNTNSFDKVEYRSYTFTPEALTKNDGETDEAFAARQETAKKAAKDKADAMLAAITDEESFNKLAKTYAEKDKQSNYDNPDATKSTAESYDKLPDTALADWLYDAARVQGDKAMVEGTSGYTVAWYNARARSEVDTVNVRHILAPYDPTSTTPPESPTDEQKAAAKEKIDKYFAEWQTMGSTEDAFAQLAGKYGTDATANTGGMMENIKPGRMTDTFDAWIFDAARKVGDCEIVETNFGYHMVYFSAFAGPEWKASVDKTLRSTDYKKVYDEVLKEYTVTVDGKVVVPEPETQSDETSTTTDKA